MAHRAQLPQSRQIGTPGRRGRLPGELAGGYPAKARLLSELAGGYPAKARLLSELAGGYPAKARLLSELDSRADFPDADENLGAQLGRRRVAGAVLLHDPF